METSVSEAAEQGIELKCICWIIETIGRSHERDPSGFLPGRTSEFQGLNSIHPKLYVVAYCSLSRNFRMHLKLSTVSES